MNRHRMKMVSGEWYLDDVALSRDRRRCRQLLDRLNAPAAQSRRERLPMMRQLLGDVGAGAVLMSPFVCSYGYNVFIGAGAFVNIGALFMDDARIDVGEHARVGPRVQMVTALHPVDSHEQRRQGWERALSISVGVNAWLGAGVIVCPGVSIGDNAVVGAGSVVVDDVPAETLAVGNPTRPVRTLPPAR